MSEELSGDAPRCSHCGHALHRSRPKTLAERFTRHVLRKKKYRCRSCDQVAWFWKPPRSEAWRARAAAEALRLRRDPIARRAFRLRWRRRLLVALVAVLGGGAVGLMVARSQENVPSDTAAP